MNMKYLLFYFFFLGGSFSYGQLTWIAESQTDETVYRNPVELSNGNIMTCVDYLLPEVGSHQRDILLFSESGELVSRKTTNSIHPRMRVRNIAYIESIEVVVISSVGLPEAQDSSYVVFEFYDSELNYLADTSFLVTTIDNQEVNQISSTINNNNELIVAAAAVFDIEELVPTFYFIVHQDLKVELAYSFDSDVIVNDLIQSWDDNFYLSQNWPFMKMSSNFDTVILVDTQILFTPGNHTNIHRWVDSTYLIGQWGGLSPNNYDLIQINLDLDTIKTNGHFDVYENGTTIPGSFYSSDYVYYDKFYIAGGEYNPLAIKRFLWVAQHDENLDRNWIRFYIDDEALGYVVSGVRATQDGGVILSGIKTVDFVNGSTIDRGFMYKFDCNGNFILTDTEDVDLTLTYIDVFPNPSPDQFSIDIHNSNSENYSLNVYNISGQLVHHQENLTVDKTTLDFSHFNTGTYLYSILADGYMVAEGKWVKL